MRTPQGEAREDVTRTGAFAKDLTLAEVQSGTPRLNHEQRAFVVEVPVFGDL